MATGSFRTRFAWGHLAFVAAVAVFCLWYWHDARRASDDVENLLLIQPAALVALLLCAVIAAGSSGNGRPADDQTEGVPSSAREGRGIAVAVLLGLYVAAVIPMGFDLATFAFLAAAMYVLGERRLLVLVGYSAALALGMSYAFKSLLSVPVPTLLF